METSATPRMVGPSEAARILGINKSVISRQVQKFGLPKDDLGRFDFAAYQERRASSLNPLMRRGGVGGEAPPSPPIKDQSPPVTPPAQPSELMDAAAAHKKLQAQRLQIDIDERQGRLIPRAVVRESLMTAARMARDGFLGIPARHSGELATMTDPTEIQSLLDRVIREQLDTLAAAFAASVNDEPPPT